MRWIDAYFQRSREACWELYRKYYAHGGYQTHLARYRAAVLPLLHQDAAVLDAGCGSAMTFTREIRPLVGRAVGVDLDSIEPSSDGVLACRTDLGWLPFPDATFDVIVSMSVVEHLEDPARTFAELARVLKPGGTAVFLTPNRLDYVSIIAQATPHWFHRWMVSRTLGKAERDVFPTRYRANTRRALRSALLQCGLSPVSVELFNQYPAYLMFSPLLFRIGVAYERLTSRHERLAPLRGWLLAVARRET